MVKILKVLSKGIMKCYKKNNLRYSQMSAKTMYKEINTKNNLPAQIEILSEGNEKEYKFYFIAKGGGSANKTFFYQATPSLLKNKNLEKYLIEKIIYWNLSSSTLSFSNSNWRPFCRNES